MSDTLLQLVLTFHWFDELDALRKDVEYRRICPFWRKRIWDKRDVLTHATFSRGYTSETILRRIARIDIGPCPYDGWDGQYYRIHLKLMGYDE